VYQNSFEMSGLASNVPLDPRTAEQDAKLNPTLTQQGLLGQIIDIWQHIFVLCYSRTCDVHSAQGAADGRRMWWPSIQDRITVVDAAKLDAENRDIIEWAGCNLPNRSAGRSGEPAIQDPCRHAGPTSGGKDWRRNAKHQLTILLAHLTLIETAAKLGLQDVLILEADLVPTLAVARLSPNATHATRVAQRMRDALDTRPWSVMRMSGMFYSKEYAAKISDQRLGCSRRCHCTPWGGSALIRPLVPRMRFCQVAPAPSPTDQILPMLGLLDSWCDVRDSAAYAVHKSAYKPFIEYLHRLRALPGWLKDGSIQVPSFDAWMPHALPNIYVLPSLVSQPSIGSQGQSALLRQKSALQYMRVCAMGRQKMLSADKPRSKPMKLSSWATRHLYVLKDKLLTRQIRWHTRKEDGQSNDHLQGYSYEYEPDAGNKGKKSRLFHAT
jgi:hypothetical protein